MQWNLENIRFLHPPYDFVGSFDNEHMQKRHKAMQDEKVQEIETALDLAQLPVDAMNVLNQTEHITFVHNNLDQFRATDSLEATVLRLYYRKNTPFAPAGRQDTWLELLALCDRHLLLAQGNQFPQKGSLAYRGSLTDIEYGLSWTTDIKEAKWILNRWADKEMGGGTVYSAHINAEDILVYKVDKKRQEVILKPECIKKIQPEIITSVAA